MKNTKANGKADKKEEVVEKPITKKETHLIEYKFSEEELKEKSKRMANACQEKSSIEDEFKQVKTSFKYKIEGKEAEINILSNHVANGYEMKNVECDVILNFEKGEREYWFEKKFYGSERLTGKDHQLQLDQLNKEAEEEEKKKKNKTQSEPVL